MAQASRQRRGVLKSQVSVVLSFVTPAFRRTRFIELDDQGCGDLSQNMHRRKRDDLSNVNYAVHQSSMIYQLDGTNIALFHDFIRLLRASKLPNKTDYLILNLKAGVPLYISNLLCTLNNRLYTLHVRLLHIGYQWLRRVSTPRYIHPDVISMFSRVATGGYTDIHIHTLDTTDGGQCLGSDSEPS